MRTFKFALVFFVLFSPVSLFADEGMIEKDIVYTVDRGDYGGLIEGKIGIPWNRVASANSLSPDAPLEIGQKLKIKFMRIIPMKIPDGIVINLPDRTLYRFENGSLTDYYFICAGKPTWQTPQGEFTVTAKAKDPTWYVPVSIQKELEEEGKEVLLEVPPGAENPLGRYWLQLSLKGVGLHGTNAPQSIYKFRSHGCMRLRPEVAEFLFKHVPAGTKGIIIYEPVKMLRTADNRVLMEVYRDFYKTGVNYNEKVAAKLKELNAPDLVDQNKIKEAIEKKDGLVRDVTLKR